MCVAMLTYTHGYNIGNFHFVWKVLDHSSKSFVVVCIQLKQLRKLFQATALELC